MKKTKIDKKKEFHAPLFEEKKEGNPTLSHKSILGLDIPHDYFQNSKQAILKEVSKMDRRKRVFRLKPLIAYSVAASIVLIFGLSLWFQFSYNEPDNRTSSFNVPDSEILIHSLFTSDTNIDQFIDAYIMDDILAEADLSEQKLENIFINSLLIEDTLIDAYLNEHIIDNLIL